MKHLEEVIELIKESRQIAHWLRESSNAQLSEGDYCHLCECHGDEENQCPCMHDADKYLTKADLLLSKLAKEEEIL